MQTNPTKVASFSVAAMDYFPQQDQYFAGGNALNQAIRFAQLNTHSAFIGALGDDAHGVQLRELLSRNNVDLSQLAICGGQSASNRLINDAEGERYGEDGAWDGGVYEGYSIPESSWRYIRDFHIWSSHASCPNFFETLKRKHENFLCVDYLHLPDIAVLAQTLSRVDIAYVGGDSSMIESLSQLSLAVDSLLVLTLGANGSVAFFHGKAFYQDAIATKKVIDTTGCGDAFQAAFSLSYFQHRNIELALEHGAKAGLTATTHFGGVPW
ncbi:carbohydrate kinase family protein [Teredinibacter waterburyi]|jgi:Sugar kinases, ribokinase family|uniref:carbohydrate kinase family protein n=1 Tax=Teredinibacter waterburyi TaxID=1500538 RepID=UPI00165FE26A|nr:carbohydrate kinase family protein [Teredinibacter waterburyi]